MKTHEKIILWIGAGATGFCIGAYATTLDYDETLTAGNILQASSTIASAVIVALILQPKIGAKTKEKELLLKLYDQALKALEELGSLKNVAQISEKAAALKQFATRCYTASELITSLSCYSVTKDNLDFTPDIAELRKLTTDSPLNQMQQDAGGSKKSLREGIIQLAADQERDIETKISTLTLRIIKLQVAINKS